MVHQIFLNAAADTAEKELDLPVMDEEFEFRHRDLDGGVVKVVLAGDEVLLDAQSMFGSAARALKRSWPILKLHGFVGMGFEPRNGDRRKKKAVIMDPGSFLLAFENGKELCEGLQKEAEGIAQKWNEQPWGHPDTIKKRKIPQQKWWDLRTMKFYEKSEGKKHLITSNMCIGLSTFEFTKANKDKNVKMKSSDVKVNIRLRSNGLRGETANGGGVEAPDAKWYSVHGLMIKINAFEKLVTSRKMAHAITMAKEFLSLSPPIPDSVDIEPREPLGGEELYKESEDDYMPVSDDCEDGEDEIPKTSEEAEEVEGQPERKRRA